MLCCGQIYQPHLFSASYSRLLDISRSFWIIRVWWSQAIGSWAGNICIIPIIIPSDKDKEVGVVEETAHIGPDGGLASAVFLWMTLTCFWWRKSMNSVWNCFLATSSVLSRGQWLSTVTTPECVMRELELNKIDKLTLLYSVHSCFHCSRKV